MGQLLHETLWLQEQATVRSNQGIKRRCRALVPGTTSGDLLPVTSTCGWDMITDWPRILTLTCKPKTSFDKRQKTKNNKAQDTELLTKQNGNKRLPSRANDKGQEKRAHNQRQDTEGKVRRISQLPNRHKTRHEDNNSRPRTPDITKDKRKYDETHCTQFKLGYEGLKNLMVSCKIYDKRRKKEHLHQIHNQKLSKILPFILIFLFLPSATSRCITLPDNNINQKGRTAKVKFSTVDCSIQKISIPLSSQESNAGLLPLQFKVYEYGTKPGEELTTKLPDKTTNRPGDDPFPSLPIDTIIKEVINEVGKEVTLKSEQGNIQLTEDGKHVSESKSNDFKVTETLAEINLFEEDGKLLPQPGPQNVVNSGLENNDIKPESNTDEEIVNDENKGQETVGKVTQSSLYGGEITPNEKEPTFNNEKEIIPKDPLTNEKVTQPNKDVKFTENLSNGLEKEVRTSTKDITKIENEPGVNLDIAHIAEVQSDNYENKPNDFESALNDPIGKNVEEESYVTKDNTMIQNNFVENHLKEKKTTQTSQTEEDIATLKQENPTQADVKISIVINEDNSAIVSSQDKTILYSDNNTKETTTKQLDMIDEIMISNHHSTGIPSIEIKERTKEISLNEVNTVEAINANIFQLSSNPNNAYANSNDITEKIQRETKEPSNISNIQMTEKQNITKETSNENTADKFTMSIISNNAKSTYKGPIIVPTNFESGHFSVNSKETKNVEEDDLEKSTIGNYGTEMSHQDNPTLNVSSNDVEMKITLEDEITTISTRESEHVTLEDVKQDDTRTEIYDGNYITSKSFMTTEKYDENKMTNENLYTGNTETEEGFKDALSEKVTTVIYTEATNKITAITELIVIGANTDKKDTNLILDFDTTTQVSVSEKEILTHGVTSREPQQENQTTKSPKEALIIDETTVYISKERPIDNEGSYKTNNIEQQSTEILNMTKDQNQSLNTTEIAYSNDDVMITPNTVSDTEITSR